MLGCLTHTRITYIFTIVWTTCLGWFSFCANDQKWGGLKQYKSSSWSSIFWKWDTSLTKKILLVFLSEVWGGCWWLTPTFFSPLDSKSCLHSMTYCFLLSERQPWCVKIQDSECNVIMLSVLSPPNISCFVLLIILDPFRQSKMWSPSQIDGQSWSPRFVVEPDIFRVREEEYEYIQGRIICQPVCQPARYPFNIKQSKHAVLSVVLHNYQPVCDTV